MSLNPALSELVTKVSAWGRSHVAIRRIWLFGSRLRVSQPADSDLVLAVEIDTIHPHESSSASWMVHHKSWRSELESVIPYPVHLLHYDSENVGSNVVPYVEHLGSLIYERAAPERGARG